MSSVHSQISDTASSGQSGPTAVFRVFQWIGGLSLSTVILFLILFLITIILRRKGYGVRLGLFCIVVYARPGSRRFPDGCEVRLTSRIVGFFFGGCRGPWLDISAERFYMRLRPTLSHPRLPRRWMSILRFFRVGVAAVDRGYWSTFFRNLLTRIAAFWIRGLRLRVDKVRVWKDGGTWECKAEQLVLAGHAVGVFGSKYSLSVNELFINICKTSSTDSRQYPPVHANLSLRKGVEIIAYLAPRLSTIFRPCRLAIMDDVTFSITVRDCSFEAPNMLDASITHVVVELSPGYSQSLRAKLARAAPVANRPHRPKLLRYWEGNGAIHGLAIRFELPSSSTKNAYGIGTNDNHVSSRIRVSSANEATPKSQNGGFLRLESIRLEAYGKSADERHDAMTRASVNIRGCSAGSIAFEELSRSLYETPCSRIVQKSPRHEEQTVETIENIDKIVSASPEALLWIEDVTTAIDRNFSKSKSAQVDIAGNGGIVGVDPVGLHELTTRVREFLSNYYPQLQNGRQSSSKDETREQVSQTKAVSEDRSRTRNYFPTSLRFVCDMRHWTMIVLGHGQIGAGNTKALVASCDSIVLPQVDLFASGPARVDGQVKNFVLMHWSNGTRSTNIVCKEGRFNVNERIQNGKRVFLRKVTIAWDFDVQAGIKCLPIMFSSMRSARKNSISKQNASGENSSTETTETCDEGEEDANRGLNPNQMRMNSKHARLLQSLSQWQLSGLDIKASLEFPDGPKMGVSIAKLPTTALDSGAFVGHHVVLEMQDKKIAYAKELGLSSPLHTLHREVEKRSMSVDVRGLRFVMPYDFPFGYLLQDWILRVRAALAVGRKAREQIQGMGARKDKNHYFPDFYLTTEDAEIHFEDHPLAGFLTTMLPLMQDEARERMLRDDLMSSRIQQLSTIVRAEIAGTAKRCRDSLKERDSKIWVERVKRLMQTKNGVNIADGYLPKMRFSPGSSFLAASLSLNLVMDDAVRQKGSTESIRRLKMLDDYELGEKKYNKRRQHDSDAWNSIGFRMAFLDAREVELRLRDFKVPFVSINRMHFDNSILGKAVQATLPPYLAETTVAIGRRRRVKIVKGLAPSKSYVDIHLVIDTLNCRFNSAFLSAISEFGRSVSRFFGGGKNPSPRIPWFDTLRVNMHGRMRITAKKFKGQLTSSIYPYAMTKHYAEIDADNFEMLTSRLESTKEDPFPISFTLHNWHIRPHSFDKKRRSEIVFESVCVGFTPRISVLSGDPQDHYFVPFPSREEVQRGGPGIGKGVYSVELCDERIGPVDNGFGTYTDWTTGLHRLPGFDSFRDFKTDSVILGLNIQARHSGTASATTCDTSGSCSDIPNSVKGICAQASVVYSDAISSLIKVIKTFVHRPISCKLSPRKLGPVRKPSSRTGLSTTMRGLDVFLDVKALNVMLYNNLEPGHGLFISVGCLSGELWKRTEISKTDKGRLSRTSKFTRRRFNIIDIYSSIQVPGLDLAVDSDNMGKLLTVDKISLSDDPRDESRYMASPSSKGAKRGPSSGFGNEDLSESPFYTFSERHPLQRGKTLDKVQYDKRLLVDRVRLIWSPARRAAVFAWPEAFKEKSFLMRAPKANTRNEMSSGDNVAEQHPGNGKRNRRGGVSGFSPESVEVDNLSRSFEADLLDDTGEDIPPLILTAAKGSEAALRKTYVTESSPSPPVETAGSDPLSPPMLAMSRPSASVMKRQGGSMVDLLAPYLSKAAKSDSRSERTAQGRKSGARTQSEFKVLKTSPKFALYINDCQVAFGSYETSGIVFLTSNAVRVGIVDKRMQKHDQVGASNDRWADRQYRFHLNEANLFTLCAKTNGFDFSPKNWIPEDGKLFEHLALLTTNPICMDLMYISSSSLPREDGTQEEEDYILRPSLLFINIPDISMSTNTNEFHAATDVVRKVLMQSMRYSELVNEELAQIRYNLQLLGAKLSSEDLDEFMRRLNNVTRQFLYAGDTFQQNLVAPLMLPSEASFSENLLRYKAKAKAVATYTRQDQRASSKDVLYPTMYVSYSFDRCSWELRERRKDTYRMTEDPFVEITLEDLVCRHIFYVGRGSSTEMTFGNICAQNKMRTGYFQGILQPASTGTNYGSQGSHSKTSRIKASDGTSVAFRWYSTQEDKIGGIQVYETLTIQVAPMTAAVTRKLYSSVSDFIFSSSRSISESEDGKGKQEKESTTTTGASSRTRSGNASSSTANEAIPSTVDTIHTERAVGLRESGTVPLSLSSNDVSEMAQRGDSSILFKYVFIDAFELTASYKNKETQARGILDFFDLFVTTPSYSYSSEVWTWKRFAAQIRKDLVMTFARRGVSNLAKIKLLPGYGRARRKLARGADSFRESIYNVLPSGAGSSDDERAPEYSVSDDAVQNGVDSEVSISPLDPEDDELADEIDVAVADISSTAEKRREKIVKALYGSHAAMPSSRSPPMRRAGRPSSLAGSVSSSDSLSRRRVVGRFKPPLVPDERRAASGSSRGSADEEGAYGLFSRFKRKVYDNT